MIRKGLIIGITFLMICASLVIVPTETEAAENFDALISCPDTVSPLDLAWNPDGSAALAVGGDPLLDGNNAALYYPETNSWTLLTLFPSGFTGYTLTAVVWAEGLFGGSWVCVGGTRGAGTISAFYVVGGTEEMYDMPLSGSYPNNYPLNDIASDEYGNVIVTGSVGADFVWFYSNNSAQWYTVSNDGDAGYWRGIDYDSNNGRYYIVGRNMTGNPTIKFTDPISGVSSVPGLYYHYDSAAVGGSEFKDIYWNNDPALAPSENFAVLICSDNNLYTISPFQVAFNLEVCSNCPAMTYIDVAWNTDTWDEATFIGTDGDALIYQYNMENDVFVELFRSPGVNEFCVAYKPPASPGWPMVLSSGGATKVLATEFDISTKITANAVFPHLYWVGFNDTSGVGRMDQQVPVDAWYNFTLSGNYSLGWANTEIEVWAWHDQGNIQAASVYPAEDDQSRNLAFRLHYDVFTTTYTLLYPGALEVQTGVAPITDTLVINPTGADYHILELPIYLGSQIRWGDGNGFGSGDDLGNDGEYTKALGLQDIDSWDFEVQIRDATNPSALDSMYGEFGVDETVSVTVAGNPSGNAPPGSANVPLANPSQITYSANTQHWVNVSIPNLMENGVGPLNIPAINVDVQNINPYATGANSEISGITAISGAGTDMRVWGGAVVPIVAPSNGTIACGPWVSNFNAGGLGIDDFTILDWYVTVPGATAEGVYWAVITITIDS